MSRVSVTSTLKRSAPVGALLLEKIKNRILGKSYELSVAFVGDARSQTLNKTYRGKDKPTNVLSFPLDRTHGEIIIDTPLALREARSFGTNGTRHSTYLFIHGCLHLKGYSHGDTMDAEEDRLRRIFGV
jgi:probable rRNA maturation factor